MSRSTLGCSSTKGRARSSKVVIRPTFHEEPNLLDPGSSTMQALLTFKPTEATSSVLDLILSLFTARVITFEPTFAQLPFFSCSLTHESISNFANLNRSCARNPLYSRNKRFRSLRPRFSAQNSGIPLRSVAPAAQQIRTSSSKVVFRPVFHCRKRMSLSRKLYEQAL